MENKIRELSNANKRKRLLKRVVALLSVVVMLFTVNSLKLRANTLSRVPACGLKKHTHNAKCYDGNGNLICGKVEHQHTDACYQVAPDALDLEIEGDGGAVDDASLEMPLDLSASLDDSVLQLDDSLLELDGIPVDDVPAQGSSAQNNNAQYPTYELGEKAKLSKIIEKTRLKVRIDEVNEVGAVDYDGTQASLLSIEQIDGDYIVAAARDFDVADLAIVTANGIEVVRLVGGRALTEAAEQTDQQIDAQSDAQTVEQTDAQTDQQIDLQIDPQSGAESAEGENSPVIVSDDQVVVDEFNDEESDTLALEVEDALAVQQVQSAEEQGSITVTEEEAPAEDQGGITVTEEEAPAEEQGGITVTEEEAPAEDQGGVTVAEEEQPAGPR